MRQICSRANINLALHDLVVQGGELTKSLLGFQSRLGFGFDRQEWTQT